MSSCRPPLLVFGPQFATATVGLRAAVGKALPSAGRRRWSSRRSWQTSQHNHAIMVPFFQNSTEDCGCAIVASATSTPAFQTDCGCATVALRGRARGRSPKRWRLPDSGARGRTGNHGQPRPPATLNCCHNLSKSSCVYSLVNNAMCLAIL